MASLRPHSYSRCLDRKRRNRKHRSCRWHCHSSPTPPNQKYLGESIISLGIVPNGIPFGAPDGKLTSIFFLVCCIDDKTHLQVLARLTRLFRREGFLEALREMNSQADIWHLVRQTELSLMLPA
ncbi:MAG: hypothetical protein EBQ87_10390 [Planctomycetes bacterium]|nr:hypothetical protein [Planctomycetota bacterium]